MSLCKSSFGDEFLWGVSTAAYQIEGGYRADGKGISIWDIFANTPGKIKGNQNANIACDFYNRYAQDVALMRRMHIPNFRFSLSWSRIFPYGIGVVNSKGVDFYNKLIDFCLELDIQPWVTLYHWDLPYALEVKGGWTNRSVVDWFSDYVAFCINRFGDRVENWMVLNEPMVFTGAGYFLGIHAPGKKGLNNFLAAAHHAALCQAEGGRIIKAIQPKSNVGTTFSCSQIQAWQPNEKDAAAAVRVDALLNRMFVEPLAGLGYPTGQLKLLNRLEPYIKAGDEQRLAFNMDFIGVQNYTREIISHSYLTPLLWAKIIKPEKRKVPITEMNWEIYPECIYDMLVQFNGYNNFKKIIVTENGAAFPDRVVAGQVHDELRLNYINNHLKQVLRAKNEGYKADGYFVWSFTDNFEWAEGYRPRFGLVYIDYQTQRRIIKSSGHWYSQLLQGSSSFLSTGIGLSA